jgi:hypothetical protein
MNGVRMSKFHGTDSNAPSEGPSRRAVLSFAGIALGTSVVHLAAADPATAATVTDSVALQPLADEPVAFFSAEKKAVVTYPRQLAVQVLNSAQDLPAGTRFDLTFDPRLYDPLDAPIVTMAGKPFAEFSVADPTVDEKTGLITKSITLRDTVAAARERDSLTIVLGTVKTQPYPVDLIRQPGRLTSTLRARRAKTGRRHALSGPPGGTSLDGLPWGIELSALWDRYRWGAQDKFVYYFPRQVTIRSVGPAAAPAAAFQISLDPQVIGALEPTFLRLNDRKVTNTVKLTGSTRSAYAFETTWSTSVKLKPGDVLDIGFTSKALPLTGALPGVRHPVVVLAPMGRDPRQRNTGKTAVTRLDSVWVDD